MAHHVAQGAAPLDAAREAFRALVLPAAMALSTAVAGFATIYLIFT